MERWNGVGVSEVAQPETVLVVQTWRVKGCDLAVWEVGCYGEAWGLRPVVSS
jgi:hypothetical protein